MSCPFVKIIVDSDEFFYASTELETIHVDDSQEIQVNPIRWVDGDSDSIEDIVFGVDADYEAFYFKREVLHLDFDRNSIFGRIVGKLKGQSKYQYLFYVFQAKKIKVFDGPDMVDVDTVWMLRCGWRGYSVRCCLPKGVTKDDFCEDGKLKPEKLHELCDLLHRDYVCV